MRLKLFLLLTACLVGLSCAQLPTDLLSRNFDVRTELELNAETKIIDMTERHDGTNTHSSVVTILGPDTTKKVKIDNNEAIVFDATDGQCSTIQNAVFVPTVSSGSNDTSGGSGSTNETQSTKAYYWGLTDILENHDLTAAQQVGDADFRGIPCTLWRINEVTKDNTKYAVNLYTAKNGWQSFGSQNEDSDILVAIQLFGIICAAGENCTLGNITSPSELTGPSFVQTYNFFDLLVLSDDCDTILNIGVLAFCPNSSSSSSNSSSSSSSVEVPKLDTSAIAEVLIVVIHENVTAPQWNGWNFTSDSSSSSSSSSSSGFSTQNAVLSRTNYGLRNETTFLVDFANNFTATLNSSQCGVVDLSNSTSGDNSTESTPTALPDVTTDFGLPSTVLNSSYARNLLESSSLVIHNVIDLFILGSFQNFTYVSRSFVRGILSDTWISSFSIPVISSGSGSGSGSGNSTDNSTTTSPSSSTGYIMVMSWSVPESDKAAQPIRIRLLSQGTNFSASSSCFTSDLLNGDAESLYETGFQAGFFTNSWLFDIFNYQKGPLCDDALALPAYSSCDFTQISSLNSSSFLPRLPVQFISFISAIDGVNENSTFLQSWYTRQRQLLRFSFYDSNLDLQSAKIIDGTNDSFFTINGSNNVCSPNTLPPSLNVFSNATSNNTNTNGTASNNTSSSVGVFDPSSNAATQDLMVQELVVIFGKFDLVNPIFMGKRLINGILTSFWKGFDNKANITFDLYYQEAASTGGPKTFVPVRLEVYKREDCSSDSSSSSSSTCSTGDSAFICANSVNFSLHRIYNFFGTSVTGVPLNVALPPTCPIPGGGGSASASASVSASASATASGSASASLSSSLSASASASASVSASASASASATASAISGSASASASASVSPISASASGVSVSAVSVSASAVSVSAISASSAAALPSASATSSAQISIPLTRRRSLLSTTSESAHSSSHGFNAATVAGIAMSTLLVGAVIGGAFITLRNRRRRTLITEDLDTVALN